MPTRSSLDGESSLLEPRSLYSDFADSLSSELHSSQVLGRQSRTLQGAMGEALRGLGRGQAGEVRSFASAFKIPLPFRPFLVRR